MLLQIDGTLVLQLINFAIFFALVNMLFMKPVREAIEKRQAYIAGVLADEEVALSEAHSVAGSAEAKRAAARREADARLMKARAEAGAEADGILAQNADVAAMHIEKAQQTVAAEIATLREAEPRIVAELSALMLGKALGETR